MRIGEAARRAGVNVETFRYYERRGLLLLGFSLSEIEDFVRVARRDPAGAPALVRRRLEDKLGQVESEIAELRTTQAGLARALDEVWGSVPTSTSTAAYLARAGRHPDLLPARRCTSRTASRLRARCAGRPSAASCSPGRTCCTRGRSRSRRPESCACSGTRFSPSTAGGNATAIAEEIRRRDGLLARAVADGHTVVLWFEHDLFDQLQLLQVLASVRDTSESVELVPASDFLGPLPPAELEALWTTRRPVTRETIELGRSAWEAVCSGELEPFLDRDTSAHPHLAPALRRLLEERQPRPRTDRQLLEALRDGPATPIELFLANQEREEAAFLGDAWCFLHLYELTERGLVEPVERGSLPLPPPRGDREAFTTRRLRLTPKGRELV
jgi:hypothetical protein